MKPGFPATIGAVGVTLVVALSLTWKSTAQSNSSGGTREVSVSFSNAPIDALAEFLPELTGKPLLLCRTVNVSFSYATNGLSREQLVKTLEDKLLAKGLCLTNLDHAYLKLLPVREINQVGTPSHIAVEIRKDSITVDGRAVAPDDVAETVRKSTTPETEVWIYDETDRFGAPQRSTLNYLNLASELAAHARIPSRRIYREYPPKE